MTRIDRSRSTLVLVDFQERLLPTIYDGARVVDEARFLADVARALGIRVIGTEENPEGLGQNLPAIRERCDETVAKMHFDACSDGLVLVVDRAGGAPGDVVIAGCEAHVCLMQTALGLIDSGARVFVVPEACGSRRPEDHDAAIERLARAGAVLASAEMVAFEWLGTCESTQFREVLALVKRRAATAADRPRGAER